MAENVKTGTEEENSNLHCVQDAQKDERKKFETFSKPLLSAAVILKRLERSTSLLNDLRNHGNRILFFMRKLSPLNKHNKCVVVVGNDVSEHRVSTTKQSFSTLKLGFVASNGEKIPSVLLE